jgi:hypothetical protein
VDPDVVRARVQVRADARGDGGGTAVQHERVDQAIAAVTGEVVVGEAEPAAGWRRSW